LCVEDFSGFAIADIDALFGTYFFIKIFFNYFLETYQYNHPKQFLTTNKFPIDSNLCKKKVRLNSVNYAKTIELKN
jgi:hypothetical protein